MTTALDLARHARGLIESPNQWIRGEYAVDDNEQPVSSRDLLLCLGRGAARGLGHWSD